MEILASDSAKPKSDIAVYYPNIIGQPTPGKSTVCAIIVVGRDDSKGGVPILVLNALVKGGARILSQTGYVNEKYGDFSLAVVCDLVGLTGTLDDMVLQLRKIKRVTSAESLSLKDQMFDGLLFPLVLMDSHRVVAVSSSLMFEIQEKLRTASEKAVLVEAGKQYGRDAVNKIKQKFESRADAKRLDRASIPDTRVIQENLNRYMKAAGWGKITWEDGGVLERVFIQDPPTPGTKNSSGSGNLFLQGLVSGAAEVLLGRRFTVVEDHYDAQRRLLTLGLAEQNIAIQMEPQIQTQKENLTPEVKATALEEVQRLINSVEQLEGGTKPEEKLETVIDIPAVAESGNKLHVTIKRKNPGQAPTTRTEGDAGKSQHLTPSTGRAVVEPNSPKEKVTDEDAATIKLEEAPKTNVIDEKNSIKTEDEGEQNHEVQGEKSRIASALEKNPTSSVFASRLSSELPTNWKEDRVEAEKGSAEVDALTKNINLAKVRQEERQSSFASMSVTSETKNSKKRPAAKDDDEVDFWSSQESGHDPWR